MDVRVELVRIIECRHHNVSTLPPFRVVAVVRNDIAGNGVVIWITTATQAAYGCPE